MITNIDNIGVKFTEFFECSGDVSNFLTAYPDTGGVPTIGIGTIQYPNGQRVKLGDKITIEQAYEFYKWEARDKVAKVNVMTRDDVNQQQFNTLVDFAYNTGTTALQKSTLLKLVNNNLADSDIVKRFLDWRYDNGKIIDGLITRRMSQAYYYFTGKFKFVWETDEHLKFTYDQQVKEVNTAIQKIAK